MKTQIRPIYAELQGYLDQAAQEKSWARDRNLWQQMNTAIEELNLVSRKDYSRFKVKPAQQSSGDTIMG